MVSANVVTVFVVAVLRLASTQTDPAQPTPTPTPAPLSFTSCPDNIVRSTDHGKTSASIVNWQQPVVNYPQLQNMVTSSHSPPPLAFEFTGEAEIITYTVTDGLQTATCSFTVTIEDNEFPTFASCPRNPNVIVKYIDIQSLRNGTVVDFDVQASDNTGYDNLKMTTTPYASGEEFPYGSTLVTVNATDLAGNSAICSFYVIIRDRLEECQSDIADSCSSFVDVIGYGTEYVDLIWPQETNPSVSGQYIITYGPEKESKNETVIQNFSGWYSHRYAFISGQTVLNLKSGVLYSFEVTKSYSNGSTAVVGSVMQGTKPRVPSNYITFSEIKSTSARVSWTAYEEDDEFDQYHVFYSYRTDGGRSLDVGYFPKMTTSILLQDLAPKSLYIIAVERSSGSGDFKTTNSATGSLTTLAVAEDTIEIKNSTEQSLAVVWYTGEIVNGLSRNEPYILYLLNTKREQIALFIDVPGYSNYQPGHEFTGLQPLTSYTIIVVYNGDEAYKTSLIHKTRPKRIENLHASVVSDDSFTLTWDRPRNSYPDEYKLFISPHDNTSLPLPVLVTDNEFTFSGLKNLTDYYVTVVSIEEDIESVPVNEVITTGIPVTVVSGSSVDLGLPITIGAALGVFIVFLIIVIFFLLCLIPCSTKPVPPLPPKVGIDGNPGLTTTNETYQYAENTPKPPTKAATMPPLNIPPRPVKRESTAQLIEMDTANATEENNGHVEPEPYVNMLIVNSVPEQKNMFGITVSGPGRKSLFHRKLKTEVDRPVISELPGNFKRTDDDQIYDDVPQESDNTAYVAEGEYDEWSS